MLSMSSIHLHFLGAGACIFEKMKSPSHARSAARPRQTLPSVSTRGNSCVAAGKRLSGCNEVSSNTNSDVSPLSSCRAVPVQEGSGYHVQFALHSSGCVSSHAITARFCCFCLNYIQEMPSRQAFLNRAGLLPYAFSSP